MEKDLKTLRQEIGVVVEATGRMLKRERPLTYTELSELRNTLNYCAETVQTIRDTATETAV